MAKKTKQEIHNASMQEFLNISEIKDGVVVLKDGSLRTVLAVSSINFDLKESTEQEAIIFAFQRFLNTLDFPLQIMVSTRKFDIKPYLNTLDRRKKVEQNALMRKQIEDYMGFVKNLINVSNIASKSFYIIVPFYVVETKKDSFVGKLLAAMKPKKMIYQKREEFETYKNQLFQRVSEIKSSLAGIGLRIAPLNTQELIEMYYNFYNPSEFEHVKVAPLEEMKIER